MIKRILLLTTIALTGISAFATAGFQDLILELNKKQVEAVRGYIAENPEAEDLAEANEHLVYLLISTEDYDSALAILEKMYADLPTDKSDQDLSTVFGATVVPMIQMYRMSGREEDAAAFIARVREDFKDHAMFDTINEALDEFSKMFDQPGVGDTLDISFTALDGREVKLADLKGKVVLVDFWATWCVPCLKVMPEIKKLYSEYHDKGLEVIGISLDSDREKLESYLAKEEIAWPQYFDGEGWENAIAKQYGIESIPSTFLIGADGLIAATDSPAEELLAKIDSLIRLAASEKKAAEEAAAE